MTVVNWRLVALMFISIGLFGCSSSAEPDYAELPTIESTVSPDVVWRTRVGSGVGEFYSQLQPVHHDGVIYAADRHGIVKAINADNGRQLWQRDLSPRKPFRFSSLFSAGESARLSGGVVYDAGVLYIGSENGEMFALNADNGDTKWRVDVAGEVVAQPAVGEGYVVMHLGNGIVQALDAADGSERWQHTEEVPRLSLRGSSTPLLVSGGVVVGTNTGRVIVLILGNGQLAWEERIASPSGSTDLERLVDLDATPVSRGDNLYMVAFNGSVAAMELRTGQLMWQRDHSGHQTPLVTATRLILVNQDSHLVGLERLNGNERWRNSQLERRSLTAPAALNNYVIAGDRFGFLHWFDSSNGNLVGRYDNEGDGFYTAPIRVGDMIVVQTRSGRLIALRP